MFLSSQRDAHLSLLRKISCRIPISLSLWVSFSLLLDPGLTRQPDRDKGRGGVQGTRSSMASCESRRAISNVCLSIISSLLAASPKSLILLTFTVQGTTNMNYHLQNTLYLNTCTRYERDHSVLTSLCLIQIEVKILFELFLLSPTNTLLFLAFLCQAFFLSTWL